MRIVVIVIAASLAGCVTPSALQMPAVVGAARSGDTERLELLLLEGADANVRAGVNGWTPLLHAIHKDQEGSVRVLLARGASVNAPGNAGVTPLIMAAGYGHSGIVRLLIDAGADPRATARNGADALTAAVSGVPDIDRFTVGNCQTETVKALLAADPQRRLTSQFLSTASAKIARVAGCRDVVKLLEQRQVRR